MGQKQVVQELPVSSADSPISARIVFTQGGKGGVGKTAFASMLVEWYKTRGVDIALLDMDAENKAQGSLNHFFHEARKTNVQRARGLDDFLDMIDGGASIVIADMGGGSGEVAQKWFTSMYEPARENGIAFTAVGLVTPDPASVSAVLWWAQFLQWRVEYLIVKNALTEPADFGYWETDPEAEKFRTAFRPAEVSMQFRLPEIENEAREAGLTIHAVAERRAAVSPMLSTTASVFRAQAYRRSIFAELDRVKDLLLL